MMKKLLSLLTMLPLAVLADVMSPPYKVFPESVMSLEPKPVMSLEETFCCVFVGLLMADVIVVVLMWIKAKKSGTAFLRYNVIAIGIVVVLCGLCLIWQKVVCCSCRGSGSVRYYSGRSGSLSYKGEKFECECCRGKGFHWKWNYTCVENPTRTIYRERPHRCQYCHSSRCDGQCLDSKAATTAQKHDAASKAE